MSSYFILSKNTISEKYSYYGDIIKHVQIIKFSVTNTNNIPLESLLRVMFMLKFSDLYLLYSSRKLTKTQNVDIA